MISYQRPCKTGSASLYKNLAQPVNKVRIVDLVFKYGLALNPGYGFLLVMTLLFAIIPCC